MKDSLMNKILRGFDKEGQDKMANEAASNKLSTAESLLDPSLLSNEMFNILNKLDKISNSKLNENNLNEEVDEEVLSKKKEFTDYLQSADDTKRIREKNFQNELHTDKSGAACKLKKNKDNKYDIAEFNKAQQNVIESYDIILDSEGSFVSYDQKALHGICSRGIHYLIHEDGSFIEGESINDLIHDSWVYEKPSYTTESKLNFKNLARLVENMVLKYNDNYFRHIMENGLKKASQKTHIHPMEAINRATQQFLEFNNFYEYTTMVEFDKSADQLEVILEGKATFKIDEPISEPKPGEDLEYAVSDPEIAKWRHAGGITRSTEKTRSELGDVKVSGDIQKAWRELIAQYRRIQHSPVMREKIQQKLAKLAQLAKARGIELGEVPDIITPQDTSFGL